MCNYVPNNIQFFFFPNLSIINPIKGVDIASTVCPITFINVMLINKTYSYIYDYIRYEYNILYYKIHTTPITYI